ncbi:MAG: alpha/beta hydrolase [Desulfobacteraceae bacterium]|nr:alpha/beta hydrolase [Desulfobacteraceae bacterium]
MLLEYPGIYYEVHGQGRPLVLLNGIMMNTLSWEEHLSKLKNHYQLLTYDMRDQGQSSRLEDGYDISIHAGDLKRLLNHLNIPKVNIWGVSYGGQVALIFALKYPEMVENLVLSNTSAYVDQYLLSMGQMWKRAARLYDGEAFFDLALIPIYSRSFYNHHYDWLMKRRQLFKEFLTKAWFDGFIRLASSNETYDIRKDISEIKNQTLLIAAQEDIITPYWQMHEMSKMMVNSQIVCVPDTGHAAILEKIDTICTLIKGFLK